MVTRGEHVADRLLKRPRLPGKQQSMPVKYSKDRPELPSRQVSFNDQVEEWETYEKYTNYFSEYDRRSIHRQRRMSKADVEGIYADLQQLRAELFPEGDCFRDKNARVPPDSLAPDDINDEGIGAEGEEGHDDMEAEVEGLREELRKYFLGNNDDECSSDTSRGTTDSGWCDS